MTIPLQQVIVDSGLPPAGVSQSGIAGNQSFIFVAPHPLLPNPLVNTGGSILVTGGLVGGVWQLFFTAGPDVDPTGLGKSFGPGVSLTLKDSNNNVVLTLTSFTCGVFLPLVAGAEYTLVPSGFAAGATYGFRVWFTFAATGPTFAADGPSPDGRFSSPQLAAQVGGPTPGLPS